MATIHLYSSGLRTTQRLWLARFCEKRGYVNLADPEREPPAFNQPQKATSKLPDEEAHFVIIQLPDFVLPPDVWFMVKEVLQRPPGPRSRLELHESLRQRTQERVIRRRTGRPTAPERDKMALMLSSLTALTAPFELMHSLYHEGWRHQGEIIEGLAVFAFTKLS